VEAIAEAADTNKMTLYRHFASKDELVAEYLRESANGADGCWEWFARAPKRSSRSGMRLG
jgi:AcrR family transcriptional regulator